MAERPPLDELVSLFQASVAAEGITTGPGAAAGTSIVDAALALSGANSFFSMLMVLYPGQPRLVDSMDITGFTNGTGEVIFDRAYKGVAAAIPAGVPYKIITFRFVPAEVAALAASLGLMADAATADDLSDVTTTSAQAKLRRLLLRFSANAFSANVNPGGAAATDVETMVQDLANVLAGAGITTFPAAAAPANGVSIAEAIHYIADALDAQLTLTETSGTLLATNAQQNVAVNAAPVALFKPLTVKINLDNMVATDTIVIRVFDQIINGGAPEQVDLQTYTGVDGGLLDGNKVIYVSLKENRWGFKVTLQQTAETTGYKNFDWEYIDEE